MDTGLHILPYIPYGYVWTLTLLRLYSHARGAPVEKQFGYNVAIISERREELRWMEHPNHRLAVSDTLWEGYILLQGDVRGSRGYLQ